MSVSASITWTIQKKGDKISWMEIIQLLLENGWSLNDHGEMAYLPLHDNGMYNWQRESINEAKLVKTLIEKENAKELLGVCITWKDTNIGGSLLTLSDEEVLFSININRKTIQICESDLMTDVNWYLVKINSILSQKEDITVTSTKFIEFV